MGCAISHFATLPLRHSATSFLQKPMPTLPSPSPLAAHWALDPNLCFLNHGSFGATPRAVLAHQSDWRARLESDPVRFFVEEHEGVLDDVRRALGNFLDCDWDALALIPNASHGVATVMHNILLAGRLGPGDEVIVNAHEYPACQNTMRWAASRVGASVTLADVPFPITSPDAVIDAYLRAVTPRTRLALVSHVTSPTGLVLPVERLVAELASRNIDTLVDGAHAPGMLRLSLRRIGAAYFTGNCHKWICSPKGSGLLYVREDLRRDPHPFRPLVLSNNAEKPKPGRDQFLTEFDYLGTTDCTPLYSIPKAIDTIASLASGWPEVQGRNRDLCLKGRDILCNALNIEPPAPASMIGSIATLILPPHTQDLAARLARRPTKYHDALQDALLTKWAIQVPVWGIPARRGVPPDPRRFIRISAQLYNTQEQYHYLAQALKAELELETKL